MPAILTPALALRHLRELSTDVRAAIALSSDGVRLAGDAAIEAPARELLALVGDASELVVETARGSVLLARGRELSLLVAVGVHALLPLAAHDLRTLLGDVEEAATGPLRTPTTSPADAETPSRRRLEAVAEGLIAIAEGNSRSDRAGTVSR